MPMNIGYSEFFTVLYKQIILSTLYSDRECKGARYVLLLCFLGIIDTSRNQKPAVFSFFRFVQKNENQNLSLFIRFLVLLTKTSLPLNIWFPPVGGSLRNSMGPESTPQFKKCVSFLLLFYFLN